MKKLICLVILGMLLASTSAMALNFKRVLVDDINGDKEVRINLDSDKKTKVMIAMPELGMYKRLGPMKAKTSLIKKHVLFEMPNTEPDYYWLRISARDENGNRKVVNRLVWVG